MKKESHEQQIFIINDLCYFCSCNNKSTQQIDLSGEWYFALDSNDVGITENGMISLWQRR